MPPAHAPHISVIIPNLDSPLIDQTLEAVRNQHFDLARVEVLVVGRDGPGRVREDGLVQLIDTGRPTSAARNRNLGMTRARGDIFCFTDADCVPARDWLARLMGALDGVGETPVHVVGGGVMFGRGNYWALCDNVSWFYQFLASAPRGPRKHLPTLNLAITRKVVERAGQMDEQYPLAAGEDTEWTERIARHGFGLYFEPQAVVTHAAQRATFSALWRHGYNYGRFSSRVGHPAGDTTSDRALPAWLRRPVALRGLSPLLASVATVRALRGARGEASLSLVPGVWLSKLAWCWGAARKE